MTSLTFKYWLFIFLSSVGVIQWMAARERLRGLWLFPSPRLIYLFSSFLILGSFSWFFLSQDLAKPGLEGAQQTILFSLAALSGLVFTLLLSSMINAHKFDPSGERRGIEALKKMTFLQAIKSRWMR